MTKTPTTIIYNFQPRLFNGYELLDEKYEEKTVGYNDVIEIIEHYAAGEGDKWYYDIVYSNGTIERTFSPYRVFYLTNNP